MRTIRILVAVVCVVGSARGDVDARVDTDAVAAVDGPGRYKVGHSRFEITFTKPDLTPRSIDVEVWYPAARQDWDARAPSAYRSRLWGCPSPPIRWTRSVFGNRTEQFSPFVGGFDKCATYWLEPASHDNTAVIAATASVIDDGVDNTVTRKERSDDGGRDEE